MDSLIFQTAASFIFSALVVIVITIVAERYGTKIGGLIGTLPTTVVIALLFIGLNRGEVFASEVASITPAGMGINLVFLCVFVLLAKKSLLLALACSLASWVLLASILFFLPITNIFLSLFIYLMFLVCTFIVLEYWKKISSMESKKIHYTPMKILLRGLLAGVVIAVAVSFSSVGSVLSGIFTVFPVVFLSTMVISVREHGSEFAGGIAKSMIVGSCSVVGFASAAYILYPIYGIMWGTIESFLVSLFIAAILFVAEKKMS
ncbi:MAG: DUF3147 family protein [Euryarchaeota archaeon]|nr:DUF3147 family protein [Euryarchaeota archaeon]